MSSFREGRIDQHHHKEIESPSTILRDKSNPFDTFLYLVYQQGNVNGYTDKLTFLYAYIHPDMQSRIKIAMVAATKKPILVHVCTKKKEINLVTYNVVTSHEANFHILPQDRRSERQENTPQKNPSDRNVLVDILFAYSVCMLSLSTYLNEQTLNDFRHRQLRSYRF